MQPTQPQADPQVVNLAKSIIHVESGGDFNAKGASGESGAAQWMPSTWKAQAKEVLGDENAQMTPENQKAVLYSVIKKDKDSGLNPAQIAAKWNSGSAHGWESKTGTNAEGVAYDVPAYVKKVTSQYQTLKQQSGTNSQSTGYNPTPYSNPTDGTPRPGQFDLTGSTSTDTTPPDDSLGTELSNRAKDVSTAVADTTSGKINPVSGILQTVGAGAGAIGDTVNAGLKLIPGVKQAEGLLGKGIGKLAGTSAGQSVVGGINNFTTAHPELAGDIGAVGNIAGVVGLAAGAGEVKDAVGGVIGKALGRDATSVAEKELGEVAARTITGRKLVTENPEALKILSQPEFKPAVEEINGVKKYATAESSKSLDAAISKIDEEKLQPLLDKNNTTSVADKLPLDTYRQTALQEAKDALIDEGGVNKLFDRIQAKYGDYPSLSQMNEAKRLVAKQISDSAFGSDTYTAAKTVRSALQKGIEDGANKLGLGDVKAINQEMAQMIKAEKVLKAIEGKPVRLSRFANLKKGLIKGAVKGAAEGIGAGGAYELYKHTIGQ